MTVNSQLSETDFASLVEEKIKDMFTEGFCPSGQMQSITNLCGLDLIQEKPKRMTSDIAQAFLSQFVI